jgi:hypothetical protein
MKPLESAGYYRVRCMKYGTFKAQSGSVAINMSFEVLEGYDEGEGIWYDWRGEEIAVDGAFWIIKKDGTVNERQVESLVAHTGWNGIDCRSSLTASGSRKTARCSSRRRCTTTLRSGAPPS